MVSYGSKAKDDRNRSSMTETVPQGCAFKNEYHWYVIHTRPQQELRAEVNLNLFSIQTYYPQIHANHGDAAHSNAAAPLFPGYLFARFNLQASLHNIIFTRGVHNVVRFGNCASVIDDDVIAMIQSRQDEDNLIRLEKIPAIGDKVEITSGPFANFTGIFSEEISGAQRIVILHEALNYQNRIVVDKAIIAKVA